MKVKREKMLPVKCMKNGKKGGKKEIDPRLSDPRNVAGPRAIWDREEEKKRHK